MLTQNKIKELFDYRDGVLYWKVKKSRNINVGDVAGCLSKNGYHRIGIDRQQYLRSRLVFLYHHGYFPEHFIDHINRITTDDRIDNLREVTNQCNIRNSCLNKRNTSGVKGVSWHKRANKWYSRIKINYKLYYIGSYNKFHNAVLARLSTEQCLGWKGCEDVSPAYQYAVKNNLIKR